MTPDEVLKFVSEQQTAYRLVFGTPAGQVVLNDLAIFCRARETCVVPGDRDRTYVLEGRREVYLRAQQYLELSTEELVALKTRPAEGAISHARPRPQPES
jgi:hypothetical protein